MNKSGLSNQEYAFINKIPFESEEKRLQFNILKDLNDMLDSEDFIKAIESSLIKEDENLINNEEIYVQEQTKKNKNANCNDKLPNRADEKYTRIENYEDYEFTHCIAYEMAIRNEEVKKLTVALEKLNSLILDINSNFSSKQTTEDKGKCFEKFSAKMMDLKEELDFNDPNKTLIKIYTIFSTDLNNDQRQIIKERFIQIINENEKDYFISIIKNYQNSNIKPFLLEYKENDLEKLFNKVNHEIQLILIEILKNSIEDKLTYEYCVVNEHKSIKPEFISKDTNYEPSPEINNHICAIFTDPNYKERYIHEERNGYIAYQGVYENDNSFTINKVIPNFQQPLRMFNTMDISINPSLPLNDILSFVKKIKEEYDTKCDFKSFFELSLENLIVDSNTKNTIDNATSYNKDKWADLFYIYDYYQFYFSEGNKINKGKNENGKANKEDDSTTVAKEISLQLSFYHILGQKEPLDFSEFANIDNYESAYNEYEMDLFYKIKEKIEENKEYEKYIKPKKAKDEEEETVNFYMTADHIKTDYYSKMKKLIEGKTPEYIKLVNGKNHTLNSFIRGKNNISNNL